MASKIFFSHQKVYFWISAFDHRAIVLDKMHIVHWSSNLPDFATLHNFSGGGDLASLQFVPFAWACCRAAGYHNGVCVRGMRRRYNDGDEDDEHKGEEDVS